MSHHLRTSKTAQGKKRCSYRFFAYLLRLGRALPHIVSAAERDGELYRRVRDRKREVREDKKAHSGGRACV